MWRPPETIPAQSQQCLENGPFKLVAPVLAHLQKEVEANRETQPPPGNSKDEQHDACNLSS
jgi:hypothetical protein